MQSTENRRCPYERSHSFRCGSSAGSTCVRIVCREETRGVFFPSADERDHLPEPGTSTIIEASSEKNSSVGEHLNTNGPSFDPKFWIKLLLWSGQHDEILERQ